MPPKPNFRDALRKKIKQDAATKTNKTFAAPLTLPPGVALFTPQEKGEHQFDILLYTVSTDIHPDGVAKGDQWYCRTFLVHQDLGGSGVDALCPTNVGKPCPLCKRVAALRQDGYDKNEEEIKGLRGTKYSAYVGRKPGEEDFTIFAWNTSKFGKSLAKELNEGEVENCDFPMAIGGKTIRFRVIEDTFMGRKFLTTDKVDFDDRDDIPDEVMDAVPMLDDCFEKVLPYDRIAELMLGIESTSNPTDEEIDATADELPHKGKPAAKPAEKAKPKAKKVFTGTTCSVCNEPQFECPSGITCANGHGDAPANEDQEADETGIPEGHIECEACEGTGVSGRGRKCRACDGAGYVTEEPFDDELPAPAKEEKAPAPKATRGMPKEGPKPKAATPPPEPEPEPEDDGDGDGDGDGDWPTGEDEEW